MDAKQKKLGTADIGAKLSDPLIRDMRHTTVKWTFMNKDKIAW